MLEKEWDVIQVDKLRAILFMEVDFNFANKLIFSHHMMHKAEATNMIFRDIGGGHNNMESIELAIQRRLIGDLVQQKDGHQLSGCTHVL
jgi:hypothetical protein